MKTASVSETKNNLSAILREVQEGETFLILDRGRPVARLERVMAEAHGSERRRDLERRGLLRQGAGRVRKEIIDVPPPSLPRRVSALAALIAEREESR